MLVRHSFFLHFFSLIGSCHKASDKTQYSLHTWCWSSKVFSIIIDWELSILGDWGNVAIDNHGGPHVTLSILTHKVLFNGNLASCIKPHNNWTIEVSTWNIVTLLWFWKLYIYKRLRLWRFLLWNSSCIPQGSPSFSFFSFSVILELMWTILEISANLMRKNIPPVWQFHGWQSASTNFIIDFLLKNFSAASPLCGFLTGLPPGLVCLIWALFPLIID